MVWDQERYCGQCRQLEQEVERLWTTIERIRHFATGNCKIGDATRLKCIAAECEAEAARAAGGDDE